MKIETHERAFSEWKVGQIRIVERNNMTFSSSDHFSDIPEWVHQRIRELAFPFLKDWNSRLRRNPSWTLSGFVFSTNKARNEITFSPVYQNDEGLYYGMHWSDGSVTSWLIDVLNEPYFVRVNIDAGRKRKEH